MSIVTIRTKLEDFNNKLWRYHFTVSISEVVSIVAKEHKRIQYRLGGREEWVSAALMPKGDGFYFINVNKERRKQFDLQEGDEVVLEIKRDESKYGMEVAEEFATFLELDDEFRTCFESLTPGKQRSLIHLASKPKRSESRLHKSLKIVDHLKLNDGKLDFKVLYESFKNRD